MTLIARRSVIAAVASASTLSLLIGCAVSWMLWSTHIPVHHYQAVPFAPFAALLAVYTLVVALTLRRSSGPIAVVFSVAILGALVTLVLGAVLNEMIICHYDRYACINL